MTPGKGDYAVVLHGLEWIGNKTAKTAEFLAGEGYATVLIRYPSRDLTPDEVIRNHVLPAIKENCTAPGKKINFVGHSMGCILIRALLADPEMRPDNLGRVVMLAPPNQGSELADLLKRIPAARKLIGPGALKMGTGEESLPRDLPPVDYKPGVIMGSVSTYPFFSIFLPGRDDGIVSVENGRIDGMGDFCVVRTSHVYLPKTPTALAQIAHYLKVGSFFKIEKKGEFRTRGSGIFSGRGHPARR